MPRTLPPAAFCMFGMNCENDNCHCLVLQEPKVLAKHLAIHEALQVGSL